MYNSSLALTVEPEVRLNMDDDNAKDENQEIKKEEDHEQYKYADNSEEFHYDSDDHKNVKELAEKYPKKELQSVHSAFNYQEKVQEEANNEVKVEEEDPKSEHSGSSPEIVTSLIRDANDNDNAEEMDEEPKEDYQPTFLSEGEKDEDP